MTDETVLFGTWLRSVRARERDKGTPYRDLATYPEKLTPYVQEELAQAAQVVETLYVKLPRATDPVGDQRAQWEQGREEFIATVRTALDHLGAALSAVGCTDAELSAALRTTDTEEPSESPESGEENPDHESDSEKTVPVSLSDIRRAGVALRKK